MAIPRTTEAGIELWIADAATGRAERMPDVLLNAVLGSPVQWLSDQRTLLVRLRVDDPMPPTPTAPSGPNIQEAEGRRAQIRTNRDMLTCEYDSQRFSGISEYYIWRFRHIHNPVQQYRTQHGDKCRDFRYDANGSDCQ